MIDMKAGNIYTWLIGLGCTVGVKLMEQKYTTTKRNPVQSSSSRLGRQAAKRREANVDTEAHAGQRLTQRTRAIALWRRDGARDNDGRRFLLTASCL